MQFYNPNILYGLFAIAIPIIIHLFNFKKFKKVYFTNVAFLKNVQQQSKRHSQWKHLLIMVLRMLFIAALVIAFAGPYIPADETKKSNVNTSFVNVFLDNSFSMGARGLEGSLFEQGRLIARKIANSYKPSDKFRLLTNNKFSFSRYYVSREAFLDQLDNVYIEKSSVDFNTLPSLIIEDKEVSMYQELYLISDFQKTQSNFSAWNTDSLLSINLIPLQSISQANVFIDSVWIDEPILQVGQSFVIEFELNNQSNDVIEDLAVSLYIGEKKRSVLSVNIDAYSEYKASFNIKMDTIGFYDAYIHIDDYPVVYDDDFYFSYSIQKVVDVLCISSKNANTDLNTLLKTDSSFNACFISENGINFSDFSLYSTIILNSLSEYPSGLLSELKQFVVKGNSVILLPSSHNTIDEINTAFRYFDLPLAKGIDSIKRSMQYIDLQSEEFSDIFEKRKGKKAINYNTDLPYFKNVFSMSKVRQSSITLLISNEAKVPIVSRYSTKGGSFYSFFTSIEAVNSNFSSHAVFVPIMYNIIRRVNNANSVYLTLGTSSEVVSDVSISTSFNELLMRHYTDSVEFIPEYRNLIGQLMLSFEQNPNDVGSYRFLENGIQKAVYSFNYNRTESFLDYYKIDEIETKLLELKLDNVRIMDVVKSNIIEQIDDINNGIKLWKLFIILALMFLIFELFLLRFSK